jgi:hypothetical protein
MREIVEFRISEPEASMIPGHPGRSLGLVRNVRLPMEDERVRLIGELNREFNRQGRSFFLGSSISRHYTLEEIQAAELFSLRPLSIFEPCGEMCGTEYDESEACPLCGPSASSSTPASCWRPCAPRRRSPRDVGRRRDSNPPHPGSTPGRRLGLVRNVRLPMDTGYQRRARPTAPRTVRAVASRDSWAPHSG